MSNSILNRILTRLENQKIIIESNDLLKLSKEEALQLKKDSWEERAALKTELNYLKEEIQTFLILINPPK